MEKALGEKEIEFVRGNDMGDGIIAPGHLDGMLEPRQGGLTPVFWLRAAIEKSHQGTEERRKDGRQKTAFRQLHGLYGREKKVF